MKNAEAKGLVALKLENTQPLPSTSVKLPGAYSRSRGDLQVGEGVVSDPVSRASGGGCAVSASAAWAAFQFHGSSSSMLRAGWQSVSWRDDLRGRPLDSQQLIRENW
jgi:hypothetical protein